MTAFRDSNGDTHKVDVDQVDAYRRSPRFTEVTGNAAKVKPKSRKAGQAKDDGAAQG